MKFRFVPSGYGISREFDPVIPEIGRQPGFVFELCHEFGRVGRITPSLGQKSAVMTAIFENHAIHARPQLGERRRLADFDDRLKIRQQADFNACVVKLVDCQRFEAEVAAGCGDGIRGQVF